MSQKDNINTSSGTTNCPCSMADENNTLRMSSETMEPQTQAASRADESNSSRTSPENMETQYRIAIRARRSQFPQSMPSRSLLNSIEQSSRWEPSLPSSHNGSSASVSRPPNQSAMINDLQTMSCRRTLPERRFSSFNSRRFNRFGSNMPICDHGSSRHCIDPTGVLYRNEEARIRSRRVSRPLYRHRNEAPITINSLNSASEYAFMERLHQDYTRNLANRNNASIDASTAGPTENIVNNFGQTNDIGESQSTTMNNSLLEEEIVQVDDIESVLDTSIGSNTRNEQIACNSVADRQTTNVNNATEESEEQSNRINRKRDSTDSGDFHNGKELNRSLLRLLECPVCLEWMDPPISQCRQGHILCSGCRERVATCPLCRCMFSPTRNRAMEEVAVVVRFPCRHGCGAEARLRQRAWHEASCARRRYTCPVGDCADRGPHAHRDMQEHFQSRHSALVKIGSKHEFSMNMILEQHSTRVLMALNELFYMRFDVEINSRCVMLYVAYIGPKCNAKNYKYEVTISGEHNERKIVYTRATHGELDNSVIHQKRHDCFYLTSDQASKFVRLKERNGVINNYLDFKIEISKCEITDVSRNESES